MAVPNGSSGVLKENLLWVQHFATIEELRLALIAFKQTYNQTWIVERHGYKTPAHVRADQIGRMPMAREVKLGVENCGPGAVEPDSDPMMDAAGLDLDKPSLAVEREAHGEDRLQRVALGAPGRAGIGGAAVVRLKVEAPATVSGGIPTRSRGPRSAARQR